MIGWATGVLALLSSTPPEVLRSVRPQSAPPCLETLMRLAPRNEPHPPSPGDVQEDGGRSTRAPMPPPAPRMVRAKSWPMNLVLPDPVPPLSLPPPSPESGTAEDQLREAASQGDARAVRILLDLGTSPMAQEGQCLAAAALSNCPATLDAFLRAPGIPHEIHARLFRWGSRGIRGNTVLAQRHGLGWRGRIPHDTSVRMSPRRRRRKQTHLHRQLVCATSNGCTGAVALLLTRDQLDPMQPVNLLDMAASFGHVDVLRLLLSHPGSKPQARQGELLVKASQQGQDKVVFLLVRDGRCESHRTRAAQAAHDAGHVKLANRLHPNSPQHYTHMTRDRILEEPCVQVGPTALPQWGRASHCILDHEAHRGIEGVWATWEMRGQVERGVVPYRVRRHTVDWCLSLMADLPDVDLLLQPVLGHDRPWNPAERRWIELVVTFLGMSVGGTVVGTPKHNALEVRGLVGWLEVACANGWSMLVLAILDHDELCDVTVMDQDDLMDPTHVVASGFWLAMAHRHWGVVRTMLETGAVTVFPDATTMNAMHHPFQSISTLGTGVDDDSRMTAPDGDGLVPLSPLGPARALCTLTQ